MKRRHEAPPRAGSDPMRLRPLTGVPTVAIVAACSRPEPLRAIRTLCSADLLPPNMPTTAYAVWDGWKFGDEANHVGVHVLTVPLREYRFMSVDQQFMVGDQLEDFNPFDLPYDRIM